MLRLKSDKLGKFDIVFQGDPLIDDNARLSSIRATSAGRRKNNEWKSKVFDKRLPKEPQFTKVKTSKTTQLRLSNKTTSTPEKNHKKLVKKPTNIPENEHDKSSDKNKRMKNDTEKESSASPIVDNKRSDKKSSNVDEDLLPERVGTFTKTPQQSSGNEDCEDSPAAGRVVENPKDGVISKKQLHELYNKLQEIKDAENVVEPTSVPGLELSPRSDSKPKTQSLQESSRQDEIRRRQATPDQPYYPWGKPGAGAPTSDDKGNVRTHRNIKSLQNEKENKDAKARSFEQNDNSGPVRSPRQQQQQQQTPAQTTTKGTPTSRFARGQGKTVDELDDIEKKRSKHSEHQNAIAQQVEEKRRQKQMEKERKIKEDQEAELRFQREQEMIKQRFEEEQRKQREKEEAKLLKQKLLEESIQKAQEEALKAKEEAKRIRTKANTSASASPSNNDRHDVPLRYTRKLHREDEALKPLTDDVNNDDELMSASRYLPLDEEESDFVSPPTLENQSPPRSNARLNSPALDNGNPPVEEIRQSSDKRTRRKKEKVAKTSVAESPSEKPKFSKENRRETKTIEKMGVLVDDYLLPVHRTKASELLGNDDGEDNDDNNNRNVAMAKKSPKHKKLQHVENKEKLPLRNVTPPSSSKTPQTKKRTFNRSASPPASPSTIRQQKILEQLATLRQGLLQKEKECYQGTWSR